MQHPRQNLLLTLGVVLAGIVALSLGSPATFLWAASTLAAAPFMPLQLLALWLLPGLALLRLLRVPVRPLAVRLSLALSLSIALPPLILLLSSFTPLEWNSLTLSGYLILCGAVACWPVRGGDGRWRVPGFAAPTLPDLAIAVVFIAALLVRLYTARDLPTGLFGDSYHHTMIAQLLVDNGGLFTSWQPYAPLTTFTYHYGFHANAAFASLATGLPVRLAVVLAGQVLNAATVPLAYALVRMLRGGVWQGLLAATLTGFVSLMPAYFVNWGRYTQLAGLDVLVGVAICWVVLADRPAQGWRGVVLAGIATACLVLTHYLVTVFGALLVASYLVAHTLATRNLPDLRRLSLHALGAVVLALALAAPWAFNLLNGHLVRNAAGFANGAVDAGRVQVFSTVPGIAGYIPAGLLPLMLVGLLVAGWRREWRMALLALWALLILLCVIPQSVALPFTGAIDGLTAMISLYVVLLPLAAYGIMALAHGAGALFGRRLPALAGPMLGVAALAALAAWGAAGQASIASTSFQLVRPADMAAMDWIRASTPPDARFLVNSTPAYGGTLVAGTDAGWWLALLAGRPSTLPPITYGSERGEAANYQVGVNALSQKLRGDFLTNGAPVLVDLARPEAIKALQNNRIRYIYIGATAGREATTADTIDTTLLRDNPAFRLVYEREGVEIYEFVN